MSMRGKTFWTRGIRLAVLCHQRFAEALLGRSVLDYTYFAEQDHALVRQA
jgi:hypothetical protein